MDDFLVIFGSEIKALDNGHLGGYLVRFSSANDPDLSGEFFTKDTDFSIENGQKTPVYFNHRMPLKTRDGGQIVVKQKIGEGTMTIDETGVFLDAIIWNRNNYEKAIIQAGKKKKLGWSSGSAPHLVDYEKAGKALFIKSWPLGIDASLTPIPCEPMNKAITLKAYAEIDFTEDGEDDPVDEAPATKAAKNLPLATILNQYIDDRVDDGRNRERLVEQMARAAGVEVKSVEAILSSENSRPADAHLKAFARTLDVNFETLKAAAAAEHAQSIKGIFEETLATEGYSSWKLWDVVCNVINKIALVAKNSAAMGVKFDREAKLDELYEEFVARHKAYVIAQIDDYIESGLDERFYLKAITDPILDVDATKNIDLDDHSRLAVSALNGVIARLRGNREMRIKAGRMLSEKNRKRLMTIIEGIKAEIADAEKLLEESAPMASDTEKRAALTKHLMLKARHREVIGV